MSVDISKLGVVFGDCLLVRRLERPEKVRGLFIPANHMKDKTKEQDLWWGVVERFGLDSKIGDAYGIMPGDILGFESTGQHSSTFEGVDGQMHVWVAEEFAAVKDLGRVAAFRDGEAWSKDEPGLQPLGAFVAILPDATEETTKSGLVIPDSAAGKTHTGDVLAVSLGEIVHDGLERLVVEVGDHVLYGKYSGCYARLGKENILLAKQSDIVATFSKEKEPAHV